MRDDRERLLNILEAIQRVEEYSNQDEMLLIVNRLFKFGLYIIFKSLVKLPDN
jgi:uncharacterized protein with HEPN domain